MHRPPMVTVKMSLPIKRKRLSKNKKKSWRKTDINDVEDYLDDKRLEERTGGPVAEKLDTELFFFDKEDEAEVIVPAKRNRRDVTQLRCYANLLPDPKIKALKPGRDDTLPPTPKRRSTRKKEKELQEKRREKALKGTQVTGKRPGNASKLNKKKGAWFIADKDLWAEPTPDNNNGIDLYHKRYTKVQRAKPPKHHYDKPSEVPAVEPAHPGQSYNPTFEDHQDLVSKAIIVEKKKVKEERKLDRALKDMFPTKDKAPTEETYMAEMSAGLFDNEPRQEFTQEELDRISINPAVRRENKKTRQQRRKEKERKEKERLRLLAKVIKAKNNEYLRIKSIKKEIRKKDIVMEERAQKKEDFKVLTKDNPKRLGRNRYKELEIDVKLSEELVGSLRKLKPEGNLLAERCNSFEKRNMLNPTMKQKVTSKSKRNRPKFVEKRAHREITA